MGVSVSYLAVHLNCSNSAITESIAIKYDRVNDKSLVLDTFTEIQAREKRCSNIITMNTKYNYLHSNVGSYI